MGVMKGLQHINKNLVRIDYRVNRFLVGAQNLALDGWATQVNRQQHLIAVINYLLR
jgi:hypothetical protein